MIVAPGQCYGRVLANAWQMDISPDVIADVSISHGRAQFETGRAALSSAQFTVRWREGGTAFWPLGGIGGPVWIDTGPGAAHRRFTGVISDIAWSWAEDDAGRYLAHRVTCTGRMARMGATPLPWTATWGDETARTRAGWLLSNSGVPEGERWIQPGDFNPNLAATERDSTQSALDALERLTWPAEAVLWDNTNGHVVWQELGYRRNTPVVNLPCDAIRWAPEYRAQNDIVNEVWIEYGTAADGTERPLAVAADASSWFAYGRWSERHTSDYADQTSAATKATRAVRRQAFPAILMPSLQVLPNRLDPATYAAVMALRVGDRVRLPRLPDPLPHNGPSGAGAVMVVEGWTEHIGSKTNPDDQWELELHVSPPVWSMISRRWDETGGAWQDQTATWDQIGAL